MYVATLFNFYIVILFLFAMYVASYVCRDLCALFNHHVCIYIALSLVAIAMYS